MKRFDPKKVKLDPKNRNLHAAGCPCAFCEATRDAFDAAAKKFQKLNQSDQKKSKGLDERL